LVWQHVLPDVLRVRVNDLPLNSCRFEWMTYWSFLLFTISNLRIFVWQHVLPDVLRVREPGLRRADPSQDSQLATPLQVLSLVSHFFFVLK